MLHWTRLRGIGQEQMALIKNGYISVIRGEQTMYPELYDMKFVTDLTFNKVKEMTQRSYFASKISLRRNISMKSAKPRLVLYA